jgi:hypothetical protein
MHTSCMTPALQRWIVLVSFALLVPSSALGEEAAWPFDKLVQSKLVHCAFHKTYEVDRLTGDLVLTEGRSSSLTHFQGIKDGRARQISTRMAGARDVQLNHNGKYLHFVDRVAGMYLLTTVYGCIEQDKQGVCVTYGAMQSRNFDPRSLTNPDAVYEVLKDIADPGFCDYSFSNVQEASR